MLNFKFDSLLQETGWVSPAFVTTTDQGVITNIQTQKSTQTKQVPIRQVPFAAIPGFKNAHSHSFQFAMAGLAEGKSTEKKADNFWTWRHSMYQLALKIGPDHLEKIASYLYLQMLRSGITTVSEFHYLHNAPNGHRYDNHAELGERLMAAAVKTGINLTLVPVYYKTSDFGQPANTNQKRFLSENTDDYLNLISQTTRSAGNLAGIKTAIGFHSLRACPMTDIQSICRNSDPIKPIHIHISEQMKEVQACLKFTGKSPIRFLFENLEIDPRFNLVHATHIDEAEVSMIADSGSTVVICPSTEANLGDGIFPLVEFLSKAGKFSIGTDSHICLSPLEDLRILDHVQRLVHQQRNILCKQPSEESGDILFWDSIKNGSRATSVGSEVSPLSLGSSLDAILIDLNSPSLYMRDHQKLLSSIIYSTDSRLIKGTICRGKTIVENYYHQIGTEIENDYKIAIKDIGKIT